MTQNAISEPHSSESEGLVAAFEDLVGLGNPKGQKQQQQQQTNDNQSKHSIADHDPHHNAITPGTQTARNKASWWARFFPSQETIDHLFSEEGMGNYVAVRGSGQKVFEAMPTYVRVGMHLLFFHSRKASLLRYASVEDALAQLSRHQGRIYDDDADPAAVLQHIQSFVTTYGIPLEELAQPDLTAYPTFNHFFSRKLKPDARPIAKPVDDDAIISSSADCRLTVFSSVDAATKVWIKGKRFDIPRLLDDRGVASASYPPGSSLAVFRLAPADYHRFHSPVGPSVTGPTKHIKGEYFTVNPQAINQDFDVFTSNRRDVLHSTWRPAGEAGPEVPYALVAIGALLVGSIGWTTPAATQGTAGVKRGDELGWFAYGGSTVVAVFPPEAGVQWDQDLLDNSEVHGVETIVRVGERIGRAQGRSTS